VAPLLLGSGWVTGNFTRDALTVPDDAIRLAALGAGIHLDALSRKMESLRHAGTRTEESVAVYQEHVAPVERVLRRRGVKAELAREMAWPLVEEAYRNKLDVATVISVIVTESNFKPRATSNVGARGLMQVMPLWAGYWGGCGRDLYDIHGNLCHGTRILAYYLRRAGGDERRALLGYNGCVTGSNTPNCKTYPDKIARVRRQVVAELAAARGVRAGVAASR
jgi:soluble lytic murein transglycosylase-like protein